ncbi:acetylglutamate kinase [Oscillibacter valericigenes Sjm18-20]|nr:acetylglutamate kinase [Oscillibacter valericigenes Sjm18-20]
MCDAASKVENLMEAMPYLQKYVGKIVVIKYGGNAMINEELKSAVLHDVVMLKLLGMKPVLSHGGGPGINKMLEKLDIPVKFINGLRYTSEDIMRVVEMVLVGQVNTELVGFINQLGGKAVGLSGVSGDIYHCHRRSEELGFVGDIDYVDPTPVLTMLDAGYIPVIAPVGTDGQGNDYNINGDTAAGKLASALGAEKLMLLTDIEGLCNDVKLRDVISYLNVADVPMLKDRGTIVGGMIPKVDCCVQAIEEGVGSVHIIDGRRPHSILYEAFTDQDIGTTVGKKYPSRGIKNITNNCKEENFHDRAV